MKHNGGFRVMAARKKRSPDPKTRIPDKSSGNIEGENEVTNVPIDISHLAGKKANTLAPQLKKQYLNELHELISTVPSLIFLKKKADELDKKFHLKELTACYRLALNTLKDLLEKKGTEIKEYKLEQEKFKFRIKLLMEELMLPPGKAESYVNAEQMHKAITLSKKEDEKVEEEISQQSKDADLKKVDPKVIEEYEKSYQRLKLDFDNFRRRSNQQLQDLTHVANEKLITKLLPMLDNFNRAFEAVPDNNENNAYLQGISLIKKQVEEILEKEGLTPIGALMRIFNPKVHEALMFEETNEVPEDTIIEELRKGYMLREKVIRPSLVKVAKPVNNVCQTSEDKSLKESEDKSCYKDEEKSLYEDESLDKNKEKFHDKGEEKFHDKNQEKLFDNNSDNDTRGLLK